MRADQIPGRYTVLQALDGGGMSSTFKCKDTHLDREVVVKALAPGIEPKRLLDELSALQAIRSRHVVQLYDVIRSPDGAILGIIEEFITGTELTAINPPKDFLDFLRIAYPIAKGIADIHASGRVHRDIKRQNMKFDNEGCLKIFDFGLSRTIDEDCNTLQLIGTDGYMAPELFEATRGGTVNFSAAVDTYAFGATLVSLILGRVPGPMCKAPPQLPCAQADFNTIMPTMPKSLATFLNTCLSKDLNARPTMADVCNQLSAYLLKDKHRAILVHQNTIYRLDTKNRAVAVSADPYGSVNIIYDGLFFRIDEISGDVYINNIPAISNQAIPGSCVIVIGSPALGNRRTIITVDVSHPEAVL